MNQILCINPQQAHLAITSQIWPAIKAQTMAGNRMMLEIRLAEDAKTDEQRRYYHGVILTEISKQARPNGQQFSLQVWKEYFRDLYLGHKTQTFTNPMTGKKSRRRLRKSTEDLGVKGYTKLIEQVTAYAVTELGVQFPVEDHGQEH